MDSEEDGAMGDEFETGHRVSWTSKLMSALRISRSDDPKKKKHESHSDDPHKKKHEGNDASHSDDPHKKKHEDDGHGSHSSDPHKKPGSHEHSESDDPHKKKHEDFGHGSFSDDPHKKKHEGESASQNLSRMPLRWAGHLQEEHAGSDDPHKKKHESHSDDPHKKKHDFFSFSDPYKKKNDINNFLGSGDPHKKKHDGEGHGSHSDPYKKKPGSHESMELESEQERAGEAVACELMDSHGHAPAVSEGKQDEVEWVPRSPGLGINPFVLFWPGLVLHELAHVFGALIAGAPIGKVQLWSPEGGYVYHGKAKTPLALFLSIAPAVVGTVVAAWFITFAASEQPPLGWVYWYFAFSFALFAFPSTHDLANGRRVVWGFWKRYSKGGVLSMLIAAPFYLALMLIQVIFDLHYALFGSWWAGRVLYFALLYFMLGQNPGAVI